MNLEIIYQDRHLIAVNKPYGLLSVPGRGPEKQDCVVTRLQQAADDIRVVHRLDCHTSGVMLLALGLDMQRQSAVFRATANAFEAGGDIDKLSIQALEDRLKISEFLLRIWHKPDV